MTAKEKRWRPAPFRPSRAFNHSTVFNIWRNKMATTWPRKQLEISALFHRLAGWEMENSKGKTSIFEMLYEIVKICKEGSWYFTIFATLFVVDRRRTRFLIREQAYTHCGDGWFEVHGYFLVWPVCQTGPSHRGWVPRDKGTLNKSTGSGHERLKICGIF